MRMVKSNGVLECRPMVDLVKIYNKLTGEGLGTFGCHAEAVRRILEELTKDWRPPIPFLRRVVIPPTSTSLKSKIRRGSAWKVILRMTQCHATVEEIGRQLGMDRHHVLANMHKMRSALGCGFMEGERGRLQILYAEAQDG